MPPPQAAARAAIFANGELSDPAAARAALHAGGGPPALLIAADGGARHCRALGLTPQVVIGDFDSLDPDDLRALRAAGVEVIEHPRRKDQTDLELALSHAVAAGADDILVFGALGARWDQTLANLLLLAGPGFASARIRLLDGDQQLSLLTPRAPAHIEGRPGDTVSLIPLGGEARGVTTAGLEYPLADGALPFGSTLGVSNVLLGHTATVHLREGLLMCVVISTNVERRNVGTLNVGTLERWNVGTLER